MPVFGMDAAGLEGTIEHTQRPIYAMELKENAQYAPLTRGTFVLFQDGYKLIHYRGYKEGLDDKDELYHLANDPEELDNRAEVEKSLAKEMRQALAEKLDEMNAAFIAAHFQAGEEG